MARLRQELEQTGRGAEFEQLEGYLTGSEPRVRYHDVAERLGTTEGAVKKMVHRLRRRYGHLLREEIGATVAEPETSTPNFITCCRRSGRGSRRRRNLSSRLRLPDLQRSDVDFA